MRKMTIDEKKAYFGEKARLQKKINDAQEQQKSKSAIKKLKAENHNEWQAYLKNNKIIELMGFLYVEDSEVSPNSLLK